MDKSVYVECKSRKAAQARAPWAARLVKVCGGYMAFESIDDYKTWLAQV